MVVTVCAYRMPLGGETDGMKLCTILLCALLPYSREYECACRTLVVSIENRLFIEVHRVQPECTDLYSMTELRAPVRYTTYSACNTT